MITKPITCAHHGAYLIPFGAALFLLVSCIPYRDIEVNDVTVDNIVMQGTKMILDFSANVHNPNRAFTLHSAEGDIHLGKQLFATAQLIQSISIPARSEDRFSGQLQLNIKDLIAALQLGFDAKSWELESFLFSGEMKVKSALMKKRFSYINVPLNHLVNIPK